ncbi:MAG TPA: hypothetical protein PLI89_09495 [Chitinophagales bacterium]|nr:hypothetical protein [Chitinophagales bacterium]
MQEKILELAIMATYDRDLEAWMERLQQDALVYNRRQMLLPLLLIGAAATAAWYGICGTYSQIFLLAMMALLLFCAVYSYLGLLGNRRMLRTLLPVMLGEEADRIVWLYRAGWDLMPFGIDVWGASALHIGLSNGSLLQVRASVSVIDGFIKNYASRYQHVTTGFSVEKHQLFEAEPELLRK